MAEVVLYEVVDGVATITLNRPDVLNAMNDEMGAAFHEALRRAERDAAVGALVITGAGRGFCAGEDMRDQRERFERAAREAAEAADQGAGDDAGETSGEPAEPRVAGRRESGLGRILRERYNPIVERIWNMEKPVVAAVNGVAAGAGASLALAADIRVAAPSAGIVLAFVNVGLVPDSGANWFLPQMVGYARALELAMTGRRLDADECGALGIFNQVVPAEELARTAQEAAGRLARGPYSLGLIKRAMKYGATHTLSETLAYEAQVQETAGRSPDHMEGMRAFLEKRPPNFTRKPPSA